MEKKSHQQPRHATTTPSKKQAAEPKSAEFIAHVHELRNRIFLVVLLFIVTSALAYQFRDILVDVVLSPLGDQKLIYLTPAGGFSFIFQITMYAGALVSAPFFVFQLYKFVTPALPPQARKHTAAVFIAASLLMCGGAAFGYFVAVPAALHFLTTFAGSYVDASLTADSYLNFILGYVVGLGVLFLLPLLLIFWHWIKPLTPKGLLKSERFMIVFAMIAAAIITPTPDVVNQLLVAGPILVVYQMGVVTVLLMIRSDKRRAARRASTRSLQSHPLGSARPAVSHHRALELPTISDLVVSPQPAPPRQPMPPKPVAAPIAIPKPAVASIVKPTPVVPIAPAAPIAPQPPAMRPPVRGSASRAAVYAQARPTVVPRPLPTLERQRRVSIDGFAMS